MMAFTFFGLLILAAVLLALGIGAFGLFALLRRFSIPRLGHVQLDCPHCGQSTPAQKGRCDHCGQPLS